MRPDMKYVVLDRPRINSGQRICKGEKKKVQGGLEALEMLPLKEPMKCPWHFNNRKKKLRLASPRARREQVKNQLAPAKLFHNEKTGSKRALYVPTRPVSQRLVGPEDHRKEFNDHLNPLVRFLTKHLGKDWSEVNSEIRQEANSRSMLGFHLVVHFKAMVKRNLFLVDGKPVNAKGLPLSPGMFYVNPETGILSRAGD